MLGLTRALSFLRSINFPRKPSHYGMLFSIFLEAPRALIYTKLPTSENRAGVTKKSAGWVSAPQRGDFTRVKNPHCTAKGTAEVAFVYCYVMSRYIHTWTYLNTVKSIIERLCQNTYSCLSPTDVLRSWAVWSHFQESITGRWKLRKIQSTELVWLLRTLQDMGTWGQTTHPGAWGTSSHPQGKGSDRNTSCTFRQGSREARDFISAQTRHQGLWHSTAVTVNWS